MANEHAGSFGLLLCWSALLSFFGMAFDSFRAFLAHLERSGELIRIKEPIATELEITELADREMKQPGGGKALLIEKPTVGGTVSAIPLAINTMGSDRRMALSMGADSVAAVAEELGSLMKAKPPASFKETIGLLRTALELRHAKPKVVKTGPCKEVIHRYEAAASRTEPWPPAPDISAGRSEQISKTANDPTIADLPIQKCWPLDGGRFITLPCVVTKDPDTGERNVGMYRMQVYDPRTAGMHWQLQKVGCPPWTQILRDGDTNAGGGFPGRRSRLSFLCDGAVAGRSG